jgi:F-type H+-transporting ATPase subunit delta
MSVAPRALARRYARALLDVARRRGEGATLALRDELRGFAALVTGHAALHRALLHRGLRAEQRQRLLAAVATKAGASELLGRLLDLLSSRDRVAILPDVAEAYGALANAARGVVSAEVVSSHPLPEAQKRALASALGAGAAVELRTRVEPRVMGGVLVRVDGRTYDGTVRARLAALRRRLAVPGSGASGKATGER